MRCICFQLHCQSSQISQECLGIDGMQGHIRLHEPHALPPVFILSSSLTWGAIPGSSETTSGILPINLIWPDSSSSMTQSSCEKYFLLAMVDQEWCVSWNHRGSSQTSCLCFSL